MTIPQVHSYKAAPDIDVLSLHYPIPGFGLLPINAFVLRGSEPMLVDTGVVAASDSFMSTLRSVIDPAELKWIWLSHTDLDHIGSLHRLLALNPQLKVITTFLGVGIMSLSAPPPLDRVYFLNPGESLVVGDRTLTALKPPTYDNPVSTGFYDDKSQTLFSVDSFGALLPTIPDHAAAISEKQLRDGMTFWATVDSPWLHKTDLGAFKKELEGIAQLKPRLILSSHLPAASGDLLERLLDVVLSAPLAPPFVGPNQAALLQMLKQMAEGPPAI
jgi:flavorubredoxin